MQSLFPKGALSMHRFFIPKPYRPVMTITGMDAHHIVDVLRMQPGDRVQVAADDGIRFVAEITETGRNTVTVRSVEILHESHEPSVRIALLQGLAKGEKMDWIVQKAVEVGVTDIYPLAMAHSVVRLESSRADKKIQRWQKIAESAAKQSKRDIVPQVHPVLPLEQALADAACDVTILAYESEDQTGLKAVLRAHPEARSFAVIIGPEGGIATEEAELARSHGAVAASLGPRILRTETAGLVAAVAILYETDNLEL
jgi:16S rRNA (uracil1498-N3)-methyltransferase